MRRVPVSALRARAQIPVVRSRRRLRVRPKLPSSLRDVHRRGRRPDQIPIAPAAQPVPNFPRLRALALFGRRPAQQTIGLVIAGVKNLHKLTDVYFARFSLQRAIALDNATINSTYDLSDVKPFACDGSGHFSVLALRLASMRQPRSRESGVSANKGLHLWFRACRDAA